MTFPASYVMNYCINCQQTYHTRVGIVTLLHYRLYCQTVKCYGQRSKKTAAVEIQ